MSLARRRAEVAAAEGALTVANQNSRKQLHAARARIEPWWPWLLVGGSTLVGGLLAGPARAASPSPSGSSLMRRLSQIGLALRLADRLLADSAKQTQRTSGAAEPGSTAAPTETAPAEAHSSDAHAAGVAHGIER